MAEERTGGALVAVENSKIVAKFGTKYGVEPERVWKTLATTAFREAKTADQVVALLIVADQYGLNPFTKEIFAFPDKYGGVVPVVGVDGWNRIAQEHQQFNGIELRYAETITTPDGGKECPDWIEAVIYRKDREHPIVIREYLDECYRPPTQKDGRTIGGPWQSHTKRMLRHKAIIQAYRVAFGFHGIYDPDEAIDVEGFPVDLKVVPASGRHGREGTMTLDVTATNHPAEAPIEPKVEPEAPVDAVVPERPETESDDGTGL
jgi:phage recombination protein Bet